jgi:hypothetical protein
MDVRMQCVVPSFSSWHGLSRPLLAPRGAASLANLVNPNQVVTNLLRVKKALTDEEY